MPDLSEIIRWLKIIYYAGQSSILVPVLVGFFWRRSLPTGLRIMFYCSLMWLVLTACGEYASVAWGNNNGIYQLVDILEFWFIGAAYYHVLRLPLRRHFRLIGMVYTALALFDFFVLNNLWSAIVHTLIFSDTYTVVLKHVLIIGLVLAYFEQCLFDLHTLSLWQEPYFVMSVGLLLFYTSTIAIFLTDHIIAGPEKRLASVGLAFTNLILNLLLARAFWLGGRPSPPWPAPQPRV